MKGRIAMEVALAICLAISMFFGINVSNEKEALRAELSKTTQQVAQYRTTNKRLSAELSDKQTIIANYEQALAENVENVLRASAVRQRNKAAYVYNKASYVYIDRELAEMSDSARPKAVTRGHRR